MATDPSTQTNAVDQSMKRLAKAEFEAWAESYDKTLLHFFLFQPSYQMFLEQIYGRYREDPNPFDVLDIGCGTGTLGAMLAGSPMPARTVGLDYAFGMCKVGTDKARHGGVAHRLRFLTGDSQHLPFADGSFDVVTCSNSFHHYPDQAAVVREMHRVLRPGGQLMLIDGFRDNVIGWITFDMVIAAVEKEVYHAPWPVIHQYFVDAGFQGIRRAKFNFWFPLVITIGSKEK